MGHGNREIWQRLGQPPGELELVHRVEIREEERDRHAADDLATQMLDNALDVVAGQVLENPAATVDPTVDLQAVVARGQRPGLLPLEAVKVPTVGVLDEDRVTKALVGDVGDPSTSPLDERIRRDRRAMDEQLRLVNPNARLGHHPQHGLDRIVCEAARLVDNDLAGLLVECNEVRECPADVYSQYVRHGDTFLILAVLSASQYHMIR